MRERPLLVLLKEIRIARIHGSSKIKLSKIRRDNMEHGYVRVSTKEQNGERQVFAMRKFGIENASYWTSRAARILSGRDTGG